MLTTAAAALALAKGQEQWDVAAPVGKKPSPLPPSPGRRGLPGAMQLLDMGCSLPSAGSGGSRKLHKSSLLRPRDFGGRK